jgi:Tfp pilus assembly protein PilF
MRKLIVFLTLLLLSVNIYANEKNENLNRLLLLIQGAYNDGIYTIAAQKAETYLKITPKNDPKRAEIIKLLANSYYYAKEKDKLLQLIDRLEQEYIPYKEKIKIMYLAAKLLSEEKDEQNLTKLLEKMMPMVSEKEKKEIAKTLATIYYKNKEWEKLAKLPRVRDINLFRVIALYKLGKYQDVIKETALIDNFKVDNKDDVLYYRGLAFKKLGKEKEAALSFENITFKTPEIINFLATYYFNTKNYIKAERYFKMLSLEKKYKDYAYYALGIIQEHYKDFKSAVKYYKKAGQFNTKYGKLARKRLEQIKKAGMMPKITVYAVQLIAYNTPEEAKRFIKKKRLKNCFVGEKNGLYSVFCGKFKTKKEARNLLEQLKNEGFTDAFLTKVKTDIY